MGFAQRNKIPRFNNLAAFDTGARIYIFAGRNAFRR